MIAYIAYSVLLILALWLVWNLLYHLVIKRIPVFREESRRNLALTVTSGTLVCIGIIGVVGSPFLYEFPSFGRFGYDYHVLRIDSSTKQIIETRKMRQWGEWELPFDGSYNRYLTVYHSGKGLVGTRDMPVVVRSSGSVEGGVHTGTEYQLALTLTISAMPDFVREVAAWRQKPEVGVCMCSVDDGAFEGNFVFTEATNALKCVSFDPVQPEVQAQRFLSDWLKDRGISSAKFSVPLASSVDVEAQ